MLTDYNGTTITYDGVGNPLKWRNATALTWEKRELQKVTFSANSYAQYEYNSDGIRLSKSYINPSNYYREDRDYVLDGTKIIKEHIYVSTLAGITNTDVYYIYDASGDVIGLHYNNALYTFQKNLQGDVVRIVDSTGTVVVEYTYDAWGKVLTTTGSLASTVGKYNSFRYRSYYYDTETGWYYLQSRYYDPTVGRFLNADGYVSTGQGIIGFNMFAYCGNNPVIYNDPMGCSADAAVQTGGWLGVLGGLSLLDGPLPIMDIIVSIVLTYTAMQALEAVSEVKVDQKEEEKEAEKETTLPPTIKLYIYRYGYKSEGADKLVPSDIDEIYNSGLSFSTIPKSGSFCTTIEAINATGVLRAVRDGKNHVSVYPIGGTIAMWREQGANSIWTQALLSAEISNNFTRMLEIPMSSYPWED